ncbi:MAG TPA: hypothetical protein VGL81_19325 [Polyangiaceae bacterium]|jgi:hypothetical protein
MDFALPSSRAPKALRGDTLRSALQELGRGEELAPVSCADSTLRSAVPLPLPLPDASPDDDEPAPSALRPDQLARWLEARG